MGAHGAETACAIAGDERFQRLVRALHADGGKVMAAMPPQQLAGVVEVGCVWGGGLGIWCCFGGGIGGWKGVICIDWLTHVLVCYTRAT